MERKDHKIIKQQRNVDNIPRSITGDASLTELIGTRREADLIVRALMLLKAELQRAEATGLVFQDSQNSCWRDDLLGQPPKRHEVDEIIEEIKRPHYVGQTQLIDETIDQSNPAL